MRKIWLCSICGSEMLDSDESYNASPIDTENKCCEKCFNKFIIKSHTDEYSNECTECMIDI